MRIRGWLFCSVMILGLSLSGWAKEPKEEKAKPEKTIKPEPKSNFSFELGYQQFYLSEKEIFDAVFGREYIDPIGIRFGAFPLKNLEVALGLGYSWNKGVGIGTGGTPSGETVRMTIIPVQLELGYRFDFKEEQLLVPSVGVGGDWWFFKEDNEFADDVEGDKAGWHAFAGIGLLLDRIDPSGRFFLEKEWGIENVFLEFTVRYAEMNTENGFDFSGTGYSLGLRMEF